MKRTLAEYIMRMNQLLETSDQLKQTSRQIGKELMNEWWKVQQAMIGAFYDSRGPLITQLMEEMPETEKFDEGLIPIDVFLSALTEKLIAANEQMDDDPFNFDRND